MNFKRSTENTGDTENKKYIGHIGTEHVSYNDFAGITDDSKYG